MISISEDKQKEMANPDNFYGFTYESLIKIISDVFISARMITQEEFDNMNEFLQQLYDNCFFLKEDYLFFYDEFVVMNIDEKNYPINIDINIAKELELNEIPRKRVSVAQSSNNVSNGLKFMIPKEALIEEFEKIPSEIYNVLLYGVSNSMIKDKKEFFVKQFFNIICINNVISEGQNIINNDSNKINIKKVVETLNNLKQNLPDLLNT